jgi:hypothetical protein
MRKKQSPRDWVQQIDFALEFRRTYGKEDNWGKMEALASNAHNSLASAGPNLIYAMADDMLAVTNVPNPAVLLDPLTPDEIESAPITESIDNQLLLQIKLQREMEYASYHAYLWGTGCIKIGYDSEFGWNPALDFNGNQPMGMSLTQLNSRKEFIEYSDIEPGLPWVQAVMPHDIAVPWGTRDFDSLPWLAHRVVRHIDDIRADSKYTGTKNLRPNMSMADWTKSYQSSIKPYRLGLESLMGSSLEISGNSEYCELWEIHDKRTGRIYVISPGHDSFLRNEQNALQINGLPFVGFGFTPSARNFWRTSDADYLLQAQAELSDISLQSGKQRRANVLHFLYDKDVISSAELDKLLSADVGLAAGVKLNGKSLRDVIMPFAPGNNNALYQEAAFVRENARETTGFTKTNAGEFAGARTSAFEVQKVNERGDMRMTRRQNILANAYTEVFRKINGIIFQFWKTPRVIKMLDEFGVEQYTNFVGSRLRGRFNYKISFNSAPTETDASRQQRAMTFYQLAVQDPTIDPIKVRQWLARSFRNVGFGQIFKPGIMEGTSPLPAGQPGANQPLALPPANPQQGGIQPARI